MTIDEVVKYFGNGYRFNKKTGMSQTCFKNWKRKGFVPDFSQLKIEHLTNGELKAEVTFRHLES